MTTKFSQEVVLVAESIPLQGELTIENSGLEMVVKEYCSDLLNGISQAGYTVTHYDSPRAFTKNLSKHRNSVVLSLWAGKLSRNRRGLVPAICEANDIKFIGPDTYAAIICQDKAMSKEMCMHAKVKCSNHVLVYKIGDTQQAHLLSLPVVVKPCFEGGSIGIGQECFINDFSGLNSVVNMLLETYEPPVIIEEFSQGAEVCFIIEGKGGRISFLEAIEVFIPEKPSYLHNTIYSLELKRSSKIKKEYRSVLHLIDSDEITKVKNLFNMLGKMDLMRIDGRLQDGKFTCIELSPDLHLGSTSIVSFAYEQHGVSYADIFQRLVDQSMS